MFTENDLRQFSEKGIDFETIQNQLENFKTGFHPLPLVAPAIPGNGILKLNEDENDSISGSFDELIHNKKVLKFVPASGAASRMFKNLQNFRNRDLEKSEQQTELEKDKSFDSPWYFFENLGKFSFYESLEKAMIEKGKSLFHALSTGDYNQVLDFLLNPEGLDYANLPKALLLFHSCGDCHRTSMEEHLIEAIRYATNEDGIARIHFTISKEHEEKFRQKLEEVVPKYEEKFGVNFEITISNQSPATDTIAVDLENNPFRDENSLILFRPGGHGALIKNLNELDADVIFIKNIDNVVPDRLKEPTITNKKLIGAILLNLQEKAFALLNEPELNLEIAEKFLENELMFRLPEKYKRMTESEKGTYLKSKLERPVRVCGMVKNEGEPGGGPFWVKNDDGSVSLHIIESSQIDLNDPVQKEIFSRSTHFNPVDLVCGTRDRNGKKFNLNHFIDPKTGFISIKSYQGRDLKALELPGLWNGAMADWNTVFVEVPLITFNPVKTINDLLRENHIG